MSVRFSDRSSWDFGRYGNYGIEGYNACKYRTGRNLTRTFPKIVPILQNLPYHLLFLLLFFSPAPGLLFISFVFFFFSIPPASLPLPYITIASFSTLPLLLYFIFIFYRSVFYFRRFSILSCGGGGGGVKFVQSHSNVNMIMMLRDTVGGTHARHVHFPILVPEQVDCDTLYLLRRVGLAGRFLN